MISGRSSSSSRGGGATAWGSVCCERLARRVELADRLDLVAQQLYAQRQAAVRRIQIEDAAAHGELAPLLDQRHARVARGHQRLDQRVAVDHLPDLEVHRLAAHELARRDAGGERGPGRDHDGRVGLGLRPVDRGRRAREPAVEHVHPLGHQEGLGREALVGLGVVAREHAQPTLVR